jgi:hypothetical protein
MLGLVMALVWSGLVWSWMDGGYDFDATVQACDALSEISLPNPAHSNEPTVTHRNSS